jgi:hypothetical protein
MAAKDATPRVDPLLAMQVRLASASTLWKRTRRATDPPTPRIPSSSPPTLAQADPKLAPFLRDDFDGTAYASGVLAGGPDAPKDAKKVLDRTIADLDAALALEVREHHDELLHQLGGIDEADRVLQIVKGGVTSLRQTMGRVRDEIVEPHTAVDAKTRQLENLTRTVDLLRRVVRASKLNAKLRAALRVEESDSAGDASEKPSRSNGQSNESNDKEASRRVEAERRRRASAAAAGDLAKAAKTLGDIEELRREGAGDDDFSGVDVVERDNRWLNEAARETRRRAGVALDQGIASASQAEVGAALQVFHNLGELKHAVDNRVASLAASAVDFVREALDPKALAREAGGSETNAGGGLSGMNTHGRRALMPPPGEEERWAEILWQRIESSLDAAKANCLAVWHLQRVLAKKRDPITHALFLDEVLGEDEECQDEPPEERVEDLENLPRDGYDGETFATDDRFTDARASSKRVARAPCRRFIDQFSKGAYEALARAHASAGFAKDALLAGYPRLVTSLETLHARLARDSDAKGAPSAVAGDGGDARRLAKIAEPVAQAYLGRAFQRLSEPVDALLSPSALQSLAQSVSVSTSVGSAGAGRGAADVRRFLARVREELDAVASRPKLAAAVAESGVAKALRLMARRAETAVSVGADARALAVGQPATAAHRANAALAASLERVCASMFKLLRDPAMAERANNSLADSLRSATLSVAETARDVANVILEAAFERVSAHLAAMHDEDWAGGPPPGEHCSPYAARVAETLAWLGEAHVKPLFPPLDADELRRGNTDVEFLMASPTGEARRRFATRVFASFVRHAVLLRPMGENGRLRLAKDTAELERAVDECAFPAKFVGTVAEGKNTSAHDAVRALRSAVFLGLDDLVAEAEPLKRTASAIGHLPEACVLMLAFSAAPVSLQTPYQRAGLTPALYASWMEKHAPEEVASAADATLDAFEAKRGEKDAAAIAAAEKVRRATRLLFP